MPEAREKLYTRFMGSETITSFQHSIFHKVARDIGVGWYRLVLLLITVTYSLLFLDTRSLTLRGENWFDYRIMLFAPLFMLVLSYFSYFRRRIYYLMYLMLYLLQLDIFYYLILSGFKVSSHVVLMLSIFVLWNFIKTFRQFLAFSIFLLFGVWTSILIAAELYQVDEVYYLILYYTAALGLNIFIGWKRFELGRAEQKSRLLLQNIFTTVSDAICLFEYPSMTLVDLNESARRLFRVPNDIILVTEDMRAVVDKMPAMLQGEVIDLQLHPETDTGVFWGQVSAALVKIEDGELVVVRMVDVSRRMKNEMTLQEHAAQMKKMNDLLMGRELKMVELKNTIADLKAQLERNNFNNS